MFGKMKKIIEFQSQMSGIKQKLEEARIQGRSGDGAVTVVMDGKLKVHSLDISDQLFNAQNKEQLQKSVISCFNDAIKKSQDLATQAVKDATGLNIPGM